MVYELTKNCAVTMLYAHKRGRVKSVERGRAKPSSICQRVISILKIKRPKQYFTSIFLR
jgi:hypothetical protein